MINNISPRIEELEEEAHILVDSLQKIYVGDISTAIRDNRISELEAIYAMIEAYKIVRELEAYLKVI